MATVLPVTTKNTFYAVEFEYGDLLGVRTFVRYVLRAGSEVLFGETFGSMPGGDLEIGASTISFADKPLTVILPLIPTLFSDQISNGEPFPETLVRVWEVTRSLISGAEEVFKIFDGKLGKAVRNYRGREGLVGLECVSVKGQLATPMGIQINAQCPWVLGSEACGVDLPPKHDACTPLTIGNREITVFWNTGPVLEQEYYFRGYLKYNDLRIPIRSWDFQDVTRIGTSTTVPVSWLGKLVTVVPGCDKTIETCRARWDNEARFGGSGFKMPAYKPNFETPT